MDQLEKIINACVKGDRDAQGELYRQFSSRLFAVCLYYAKDQTEAEDILHEGFIKIFGKIRQYSGKGSFEGWMKRIMINTALERYRKQNQLYPVSDVYEYMEEIEYDDVISEVSLKELLKVVQELSPKYRMVFNLFAIEGLSHKEISELLNISVGTSKSNLARARMILQERIKKDFLSESKKNKMVV